MDRKVNPYDPPKAKGRGSVSGESDLPQTKPKDPLPKRLLIWGLVVGFFSPFLLGLWFLFQPLTESELSGHLTGSSGMIAMLLFFIAPMSGSFLGLAGYFVGREVSRTGRW